MMAEELGTIRCGGVPMAIGVQTDMATPALARFGSDEVRREFLAPAISGDAVACIGVVEPRAGSGVASVKTNPRFHRAAHRLPPPPGSPPTPLPYPRHSPTPNTVTNST